MIRAIPLAIGIVIGLAIRHYGLTFAARLVLAGASYLRIGEVAE